jgi:arginine exporter protein ArgO
MAVYIQTFYFLLFALSTYTVLSIIGVFAISSSIKNKWLKLFLRLLGYTFVLFLGLSMIMAGFAG